MYEIRNSDITRRCVFLYKTPNEVATKFDSIPKKITKAVISSFLESIEENLANSNKVRVDKLGILQI